MYDTAGVRGIVDCVVQEGVNATIFAYGCTGSGKTHTMQVVSHAGWMDRCQPSAPSYPIDLNTR